MAFLKISFILVIVYFVSEVVNSGVKDSEIRRQCNKSESDTEFDKFLDKISSEYETCLVENMNAAVVRQNTSLEPSHDHGVSQKVRIFCDVAPLLINCERNLIKKLEFCYNESQKNQIAQFYEKNPHNLLQTLICMDQGKRLPDMTNTDECINKYIKSCPKNEWDFVGKFHNITLNYFGTRDAVIYLTVNKLGKGRIGCSFEELEKCRDEKIRMLLNDSVPIHPYKNTDRGFDIRAEHYANYTLMLITAP